MLASLSLIRGIGNSFRYYEKRWGEGKHTFHFSGRRLWTESSCYQNRKTKPLPGIVTSWGRRQWLIELLAMEWKRSAVNYILIGFQSSATGRLTLYPLWKNMGKRWKEVLFRQTCEGISKRTGIQFSSISVKSNVQTFTSWMVTKLRASLSSYTNWWSKRKDDLNSCIRYSKKYSPFAQTLGESFGINGSR